MSMFPRTAALLTLSIGALASLPALADGRMPNTTDVARQLSLANENSSRRAMASSSACQSLAGKISIKGKQIASPPCCAIS